MSYVLHAIKNKPSALWILDDASPFQEYSGSGRTAQMSTGTASSHAALVDQAAYASVFDSAAVAKFESNVFVQGRENKAFSLEAWVYLIDKGGASAPQQILSHDGEYDGITIDGKFISFTTEYLTTGTATATYELQSNRKCHIVAVHTGEKNMLYVNGVLADEVDISDEQQADSFIATDGFLYSGLTTSTNELAVNAVATYTTALSPEIIAANYTAGNTVLVDTLVTNMNGGVPMEMNVSAGTTFAQVTWDEELWNGGDFINTVVDAGRLQPILSNEVSVAGSWSNSFALDTSPDTAIYGVSIDWTGEGAVVETSLDGLSWDVATKRELVPTIIENYDPTDTELLVRISFPGGITNDESYVQSMTIIGWTTGVIPVYVNRTVTMTHPAILRGDANVFEYRDDAGIYLNSAGVTIEPDISPDPIEPMVLEMWVRVNSGVLTVNHSGTMYVNGVAGTSLPVGEWRLVHIVMAAAITTDIVVSGDVSIAHFGMYEDTKTAQEIEDIYNGFVGGNPLVVNESSTMTITGSVDPVKVYEHDWSITSAG